MIRLACQECGEVYEAPEEFADLVLEGAVECAERDREWSEALAVASRG